MLPEPRRYVWCWFPSSIRNFLCLRLHLVDKILLSLQVVQYEAGKKWVEFLVHDGLEKCLQSNVELVQTTPTLKEARLHNLFKTPCTLPVILRSPSVDIEIITPLHRGQITLSAFIALICCSTDSTLMNSFIVATRERLIFNCGLNWLYSWFSHQTPLLQWPDDEYSEYLHVYIPILSRSQLAFRSSTRYQLWPHRP